MTRDANDENANDSVRAEKPKRSPRRTRPSRPLGRELIVSNASSLVDSDRDATDFLESEVDEETLELIRAGKLAIDTYSTPFALPDITDDDLVPDVPLPEIDDEDLFQDSVDSGTLAEAHLEAAISDAEKSTDFFDGEDEETSLRDRSEAIIAAEISSETADVTKTADATSLVKSEKKTSSGVIETSFTVEDDLFDSSFEADDEEFDDGESTTPVVSPHYAADLDEFIEFDHDMSLEYDPERDDNENLGGFDIDEVIAKAFENGYSDVHVTAGKPVYYTHLGKIIVDRSFGVLKPEIASRVQESIINHQLIDAFSANWDLDTSYVLRRTSYEGRRTRLNTGKTHGAIYLVFRTISDDIPTPDALGITPEMLGWTNLTNGLVLINGRTGTGKTTTIASMIHHIQQSSPRKIVTLENPIEFIYGDDDMSLIVQREVGRDTRSFLNGIDSAMRAAPHIIMVGEVRNREEIKALLTATETGHLTVSTMHVDSAARAMQRISQTFEGEEQSRILDEFSMLARGLVNQLLVTSPDGTKRSAVREVLTVDEEVSDILRTGDARKVREYQMDHEITMEHMLLQAYDEGRCTLEEARLNAPFPFAFTDLMKKRGIS